RSPRPVFFSCPGSVCRFYARRSFAGRPRPGGAGSEKAALLALRQPRLDECLALHLFEEPAVLLHTERAGELVLDIGTGEMERNLASHLVLDDADDVVTALGLHERAGLA